MIKYLSETGRSSRDKDFNSEVRFYIDPRGKEYAPISGTPAYIELASTDQIHVPGRFALSENATLTYLLSGFNPAIFTLQIMAKPKFAYNVASDTALVQFASEVTLTDKDRFALYYESTGDYFASYIGIGASVETLARDDIVFASNLQLQQWIRFTHVQDGDTATLYQGNSMLFGTLTSADIKNTPVMIVGTGAYDIKYIRLVPDVAATYDEVRTGFPHVGHEEIFWDFEKNAVGKTRCNVDGENTSCVTSFSINRPAGYKASSASLSLLNLSGEFNTDLFATFAPEVGSYNGTSDQHYLSRKVGLEIEEWRKKPDNDPDLYDAVCLLDSSGVPAVSDGYALIDYSGNCLHGLISGCEAVAETNGAALSLDGVADHVTIPEFAFSNIMTINAWVNTEQSGALEQYLFQSEDDHFSIRRPDANSAILRIAYWDGDSIEGAGANTFFTGYSGVQAMVTVVLNYTAGSILIYRNGTLIETIAGLTMVKPATNVLTIGETLLGTIGEFRIYDRALSQTEITKLVAGLPSTYCINRDPDFERIFIGMIPQGTFPRQTSVGGLSTISISAEDAMTELGRKTARRSYKWENYELAQEDGINSLFHELARIVTRREFTNYLGNSGFENATIGDSWLTTGTLARDTTAMLAGSYCGKLTASDGQLIQQYVTFAGEDSLSIGDVFNASIWIYSASAIVGTIRCGESLAATSTGYTDAAYTHGGLGWERWSVSHTVTDSTSNRMRIVLLSGAGGFTDVPLDCAMLKRGGEVDWWILNATDGSSGIISYDDGQAGTYDWIGVDTNDVAYIHPWAWVQKGDNIISHLQEMASACAARNFRVDSAGIVFMDSGIVDDAQASLGSLANGNAISGGLVPVMNSIVLKGNCIEKSSSRVNVWMAGASAGLKKSATDTDGNFTRTVASGKEIPDSDPAVDNTETYIAEYSEYESTSRSEEV